MSRKCEDSIGTYLQAVFAVVLLEGVSFEKFVGKGLCLEGRTNWGGTMRGQMLFLQQNFFYKASRLTTLLVELPMPDCHCSILVVKKGLLGIIWVLKLCILVGKGFAVLC